MCISRVGKIISLARGKAVVRLVGTEQILENVDVSMISEPRKGGYIEIFANLALSKVTPKEAVRRRHVWREVMEAASD